MIYRSQPGVTYDKSRIIDAQRAQIESLLAKIQEYEDAEIERPIYDDYDYTPKD